MSIVVGSIPKKITFFTKNQFLAILDVNGILSNLIINKKR